MKINADLHIHTALSPCGSLDMTPNAIVKQAKARGLDVIAITDHNSVENSYYVGELGEREGLTVIYGMEAQTMEDVHLLCYFQEKRQSEAFYSDIYPQLPDLKNNVRYFGDQAVVDLDDNVVRFEDKLLLNSLTLSIGEVVEKVKKHDGIVVPAHVDSEKFGLLFHMGFVPPELEDAVLEVSFHHTPEDLFGLHPGLRAFPIVTNSDAHFLADIGRAYCVCDVDAGLPLFGAMFEEIRQKRFSIVRNPVTDSINKV
jgi:PHP family Zn ribbon phosphoesterase